MVHSPDSLTWITEWLHEHLLLVSPSQLMTGLVTIIQHQSLPGLSLGASDVLLTLHEPENIELWDQEDPISAFWDINGQVRGEEGGRGGKDRL